MPLLLCLLVIPPLSTQDEWLRNATTMVHNHFWEWCCHPENRNVEVSQEELDALGALQINILKAISTGYKKNNDLTVEILKGDTLLDGLFAKANGITIQKAEQKESDDVEQRNSIELCIAILLMVIVIFGLAIRWCTKRG